MATATRITERVPVQTMMERAQFSLTLSVTEAAALICVLNKVGGPQNGFRGIIDNVRRSLLEEMTGNDRVMVAQFGRAAPKEIQHAGSIYFDDSPPPSEP